MTRIIALIAASFLTLTPAVAQQTDEPGLLDRGLGGLLDRFGGQDAPQVPDIAQGLTGALRDLGPVLQDLAAQIDDIVHYHAPTRLPNGDILIRRKDDAPPLDAPEDQPQQDEPIPL